jgi:HEAT repeat protein
VTTAYVAAVATIVLAWLAFSIWIVADRIFYDRRLRTVREGKASRLSWRVLARLTADSDDDPALGDALARYVVERDEERIVRIAYGRRKGWRQVEALRLLARAGRSISLAELERLLANAEDEVAATAATILADIPGDQATEALFRELGRGGSQTRWIAVLLQRRGAPATLARTLADDAKPEVREAAIRLLGSSPDRDRWIDEELKQRCQDALPDVRAAAARALGRRGQSDASQTLVRLLSDPTWFVQVQAARALGRLGDTASVEQIASLLASEEWWVRQAAKDALIQLGPAVTEDLIRLLDHSDAFARNSLAEVLQNLGCVDALLTDVEDTPPSVTSHRSESILRKVLAAGGPEFSASVLMQVQPATRLRFESFLTGDNPVRHSEVRAA